MEPTTLTDTQAAEPWTFSIRFEGGDANAHQIDLNQLGASLQGFARVLAVSAHFAQTGKYNKQFDALSVKVVADPVQEHHCYEISATIVQQIISSEVLWSGLGSVCSLCHDQYRRSCGCRNDNAPNFHRVLAGRDPRMGGRILHRLRLDDSIDKWSVGHRYRRVCKQCAIPRKFHALDHRPFAGPDYMFSGFPVYILALVARSQLPSKS